MDDWNIDVVVGASQKGISVPPGVSITAFSQRSLEVVNSRKTPIPNYYANLKRWAPVMESYEKGTPAYFATPPVVRLSPLSLHLDSELITLSLDTELDLRSRSISQNNRFRTRFTPRTIQAPPRSSEEVPIRGNPTRIQDGRHFRRCLREWNDSGLRSRRNRTS